MTKSEIFPLQPSEQLLGSVGNIGSAKTPLPATYRAAGKTGLAASGPPDAALHLPCLRLPSARSLFRRSGPLRRAPLSCGGPRLS